MRFAVEISDQAFADVQVILEWIAERSPAGARRWYEAYLAALAKLEVDAGKNALAPECKWFPQEVRQVFFKTRKGLRYRILYTISENRVDILNVRGPGQDLVRP